MKVRLIVTVCRGLMSAGDEGGGRVPATAAESPQSL